MEGLPSQLEEVAFHCRACGHKFKQAPDRIEDAPHRPGHPWDYFTHCSVCHSEANQAAWQIAMMASYGHHTGPKTVAGKQTSSKNLEGHPTPEAMQRIRFNAITHGLDAKTATYFPARPGSYPHCNSCEYLDDRICLDATTKACLKRTELLLQHQIAFETGDPRILTDLRARTQGLVQAIIDDIILAIVSEGVQLKTPAWYHDKEGGFHLAEYEDSEGQMQLIHNINANPLLKTLGDFLSKNSMTLSDLNMTPKQVVEEEHINGYLEVEKGDRETANLYHQRQTQALEQLGDMIQRSQSRIRQDPILVEHQAEGEDGH